MKKISFYLLSSVLFITLGACGNKAEEKPKAQRKPVYQEEEPEPVYVWECKKCGNTIESMTEPNNSGCHVMMKASGEYEYSPEVSVSHTWIKMGQVR